MNTNTPIANIPLTVDERSKAIALRIRERYPRVGAVTITTTASEYRVVIALAGGEITSTFDIGTTGNRVMSHLWNSYAAELELGAVR